MSTVNTTTDSSSQHVQSDADVFTVTKVPKLDFVHTVSKLLGHFPSTPIFSILSTTQVHRVATTVGKKNCSSVGHFSKDYIIVLE